MCVVLLQEVIHVAFIIYIIFQLLQQNLFALAGIYVQPRRVILHIFAICNFSSCTIKGASKQKSNSFVDMTCMMTMGAIRLGPCIKHGCVSEIITLFSRVFACCKASDWRKVIISRNMASCWGVDAFICKSSWQIAIHYANPKSVETLYKEMAYSSLVALMECIIFKGCLYHF